MSSAKPFRNDLKKVLILCLHRPDRSPGQRFRFEQYLDFLSENGFSFDFCNLLDQKDDENYYSKGRYLAKLRILINSVAKLYRKKLRAAEYNLIFVQREAFMLGSSYFERHMAKKAPMIFDFDDSIWIQHVSSANRALSFLKGASKTRKIIEASSLVFAGNEFLAAYARQFNSNTVIVPTTIDTNKYQPIFKSRADRKICIGWSGSFSTIVHFETVIPALAVIKQKFGDSVYFKVIGDKNYRSNELSINGLPWKADTEVEDLSEIDIGLMPLPDNEWARGKCGLKGLQYMALGIPTIMSPVGVNTEIIRHGENGMLASGTEEWVDVISQLITTEGLREKMGMAGRKTVVEEYSVEAWKEKYLEYFNSISSK